jgi:hypothetical protein
VRTEAVNAVVAAVCGSSHVKVALHELDTVYSLEDLWKLFEIHAVAQHNEYLVMKHAARSR